MLTEKEKRWLEKRKKRCERCTHYSPNIVWCQCIHNFKTDAYSLEPNYHDAAEFEARVAEKLTLKEPCPLPENADLDDCPYSYFIEDEESAFSCRWCRLKRARIAVEEEMDNDAV